ncbi:hypothetical protein ACCS60_27255 [Rhizobium acaciae]|uniref:hypothetical protein n=1 Tax=Rhizobium acaciae TaxID=2989736 RepID=UPI003F947DC8
MFNRENLFTIVCCILATYFAGAALWPIFPPPDITGKGSYTFLILSVLFFLVPFAKKIEIFQFFSYEAQIREMKEKVETARAEIKHLQSIQATLTNSLSSVNSNSNSVYVGLYDESKDAALRGVGFPVPPVNIGTGRAALEDDGFSSAERVENPVNGPVEALILLRTDLEKAMRLAVGKNLEIYKSKKDAKYITSRQLGEMIIRQYESTAELAPSFDFFFNTANAAAHGQLIPNSVATDALVVGTALLKRIETLGPVPEGSKEPRE